MDKKHKIIMIFAEGCPKCESMKESIYTVASNEHIEVEIEGYDCDDSASLDVAIENSITDIPGCKIGATVIEGEDFDHLDIARAIKKLA